MLNIVYVQELTLLGQLLWLELGFIICENNSRFSS